MSEKNARLRSLTVEVGAYVVLYRADIDGDKHVYGLITGSNVASMTGKAVEWIGTDRSLSASVYYWNADEAVPTAGPSLYAPGGHPVEA